tara:strand:+ start:454482 stop:455843 length:1362 start_codon:yes stop_codon:yes gene_type:complete
MSNPNQAAIDALLDAVKLAPNNIQLADHLGKTLLTMSRPSEAADAYRQALEHNAGDLTLQLGLAESYRRDGRLSHALAIVETLLGGSNTAPEAFLMHARLMQQQGDTHAATSSYRDAIDADPDLADPALASLLGLDSFDDDGDDELPMRVGWQGEEDLDDDEMIADFERPKTTFADVGGMKQVKEDISVKIIYPMQHAELYASYGKKVGGGILMYGPPGCGKTMLAKATAGEVESNFLSVGINDVLDMWIGNSEKNLHSLFQQARSNKPCVVFFDEVDALGASRSDMRRSGGRHLINQFLSELDGIEEDNDGLLFLAATNAPWHLDSAFRRPGRFERVVFVPPPDLEARSDILRIALAGKPTDNIDVDKVAAKTHDYSGADLTAIVDVAVEAKLHEAMKTGLPKPLTTKDLLLAAKKTLPSTGEWFSTARNHALYSNESGAYDPILQYLNIKR